jgi:hypothetical protein
MVVTNPSVASNPARLGRLAYRGRFGKGDGEWAYRRTFGEGGRGDWQRLARSKMKEVGIVAYTTCCHMSLLCIQCHSPSAGVEARLRRSRLLKPWKVQCLEVLKEVRLIVLKE